jgi:hypothetical protein
MKEFFKKETVDEYKNDPKIQKALNGCTLMCTDDFFTWFGQNIIRGDKPSRMSMAYSIYDMVIEKFTKIANSVCENKIDNEYTAKSMKNVMESPKFDVLVILAPHWEKLKRDEFKTKPELSIDKKSRHILGFVIVEKGECRKMPTTYSIQLICTRSKTDFKQYSYDAMNKVPRERSKAAILLGAYLYCGKVYGQTHGILELADGYTNISGFFAYSKQGFVKDVSLFGSNCFPSYENLPMSVDLSKYSYPQIITNAVGGLKSEDIQDDTGIIKMVPKSKKQVELQKGAALLCCLLYKIPFILEYKCHLDPSFPSDKQQITILTDYEKWFYESTGGHEPELDDYLFFFKTQLDELAKEFKMSRFSRSSNSDQNKITVRQRSWNRPSKRKSKSVTLKRARTA